MSQENVRGGPSRLRGVGTRQLHGRCRSWTRTSSCVVRPGFPSARGVYLGLAEVGMKGALRLRSWRRGTGGTALTIRQSPLPSRATPSWCPFANKGLGAGSGSPDGDAVFQRCGLSGGARTAIRLEVIADRPNALEAVGLLGVGDVAGERGGSAVAVRGGQPARLRECRRVRASRGRDLSRYRGP